MTSKNKIAITALILLILFCLKTNLRADEFKDSTNDSFVLSQPFFSNLEAYEPVYVLTGPKPKFNSKTQFSFKYRFFNPRASIAQKYNWVKGIHFSFTQTTFWDLKSDSTPCEDILYKPEFFFISPSIWPEKNKNLNWFLQVGYKHESNGKDKNDSRGLNIFYFKPVFHFYESKKKFGLEITPRFWGYFSKDKKNPDLEKYLGYFDLGIKTGQPNGIIFESHFWLAEKGPSLELNFSCPLNRYYLENLNLYFYLQYVNRLTEKLIFYKERTHSIRLGLAVVR